MSTEPNKKVRRLNFIRLIMALAVITGVAIVVYFADSFLIDFWKAKVGLNIYFIPFVLGIWVLSCLFGRYTGKYLFNKIDLWHE